MTYDPVAPLSADHDTSTFDSGSDAQTLWLRRHALQAQRTDSTRVFVVANHGDRKVVGYYALSAGSVELKDASTRVAKGMPRYPIPVVLLTRLGVDVTEQGRGLGRALLKDALFRTVSAADTIGARAVLVHCEDDRAKAFYEHFGLFEASATDPLHLLLLMSDLRRALRLQTVR